MIMVVLGLQLQAQNDSVMVTKVKNPQKVEKGDSVKVARHTPTNAMLLSIIPGGGQIYNHKAWKVPIFYAALGAGGYVAYYYGNEMTKCRNEYINRRDGNVELLDPEFARVEDDNLLQLKNKNLRNMELAIGAIAVVYILNIIDAMVDAHLYYFDISDDLSLRWTPSMNFNMASNRPTYGVSLQFNF